MPFAGQIFTTPTILPLSVDCSQLFTSPVSPVSQEICFTKLDCFSEISSYVVSKEGKHHVHVLSMTLDMAHKIKIDRENCHVLQSFHPTISWEKTNALLLFIKIKRSSAIKYAAWCRN